MRQLFALLPIVLALVLGGVFFWGLNPERNPNEIPSVLISKAAPEFQLSAVEGTGVPGLATEDLQTSGQITIVNVFASWCVPCRAEHAVLTRIEREQNVPLYGINYKDKPEDAARWLEDLGNPYTRIGSDLDGRAGIEWGISGVPETFIVSGDGTVLHRTVGPIVGDTAVTQFNRALQAARDLESAS
jgi:cytochrome c biogenesis protein CcmG/thiol:disulfide interchange protein DsbE